MANTVITWGNNLHGQIGAGYNSPGGGRQDSEPLPVGVPGLTNVTGIQAGYECTMALIEGRIFAWGGNSLSQLGFSNSKLETIGNFPMRFPLPPGVSKVSMKNAGHGLALYPNGTVWGWGSNQFGAVGNGQQGHEGHGETPVELSFPFPVTEIVAGGECSGALLNNGTVYTWGKGYGSEPGQNEKGHVVTPVEKSGLSNVKSFTLSSDHKLAILSTGKVVAWGAGKNGSLGTGFYFAGNLRHNAPSNYGSEAPVPVLNEAGTGELENVIEVAAGEEFSLALTASGDVYSFGLNGKGQCGTGTQDFSFPLTSGTPAGTSVFHVTGGKSKGIVNNAIVELNKVKSFEGKKPEGIKARYEYYVVGATENTFELSLTEGGSPLVVTNQELRATNIEIIIPSLPVALPTKILSGASAIAAGKNFGLALKSGTVYGWGLNTTYTTGTASQEEVVVTPQPMPGGHNAIAISAGFSHAAAIITTTPPPVPFSVTPEIKSLKCKWITPSAQEKGEALGEESCQVNWRPAKKREVILGETVEESKIVKVISIENWSEISVGIEITGPPEIIPEETIITAFSESAKTITMSNEALESNSEVRLVSSFSAGKFTKFKPLGKKVYSTTLINVPVEPVEVQIAVEDNKSNKFLIRMGVKLFEATPLSTEPPPETEEEKEKKKEEEEKRKEEEKPIIEPNEQVFKVLPNFYFTPQKFVKNPIIEGVEYVPLPSDKGSTLRYGIYTTNTQETITFYANEGGGVGTPHVIIPEGVYIVNYLWEFGDGGEGFGPVVTHTYRLPVSGLEAKLTVTDSRGKIYSVAKSVNLISPFPLTKPIIAKLKFSGAFRGTTYAELESKYATYAAMEKVDSYSVLEGV